MRAYSESYLNDVVETQGKLFDMVAFDNPDVDTSRFIHDYMCSKTRKSIDEGMAYVNTMNAHELLDYCNDIDGIPFYKGEAMKGFLPAWIGQFYAYYQWYYNMPSSELVKKIPVAYLEQVYPGLHDYDLELAVRKIGVN